MSGYREVAMDSGYISEPDDDDTLDPVMVGMTKGDAYWLAALIEDSWASNGLAPREIPVYFALRKASGQEVDLNEWMDMQNVYPELKAAMPPLGTPEEPPF